MDRITKPKKGERKYFPHARGDGPRAEHSMIECSVFSPRTWGWTGITKLKKENENIFPTHVGMDRNDKKIFCGGLNFPHARGDGPVFCFCLSGSGIFSPRTWGWTESEEGAMLHDVIFPTHVGMDRD